MTEPTSGPAIVSEPRPPSDAGDPRDDEPPARGLARFAPRSSRIVLGGLVVLFVALSLYSTLTSQPGRYIPDAHIEDAFAPAENLSRQAYLWDDAKSLGKPRQAFGFTPVTAAAEAGLSALGVSGWAIQRLMSALYISLAAIGVILLLREFLPRVGVAHALAAFVYAFSPYTAQAILFAPLFLAYALAPWFAWFALRGVRDSDPWRWAAAFALPVAAVGTWNVAALGYALVPAALVAVFLPLYERRGLAPLWRWTWRAALLSALIWLPALIVLFASHAEISANLRSTELPESVARTSTWSESWRGLGNWVTYFFNFEEGLNRPQTAAYFTAPDVILASFVASVAALIALALGRWRLRLLFGLMLLVSLVLMVGIHEDASPFGWLLSFAYDHSDFAKGFRATYKAGTGLMLAIAILLGVGVAAMVGGVARNPDGRHAPHSRRARFRRLSLGVLLPVIVAEGVLLASYPFWTGGVYPDDTGFKSIPRYWQRTFDYLGEQERPGRVLILPSADSAHYRWGSVQNSLFDAFSSLTPVTSRPLPQGTAESADLVAALNEYVDSPGYVKGTLGPILARLGVRWVLLQNDLDWRSMRVARPSTYDALRDDPGLRRVATFGRPGENTFAADDASAPALGENSLPPLELYEVEGNPSPSPRTEGGPPLLVEGGGDSWPALAAAGLLDGQRATTHWKYAGELAARYPAVHVDPMVLYVDNGQIITGAGTAAGVDTLLHLVRREWGAAAANALAREMVVPPHRDGGQAQFIDAPVPACEDDLLGAVLEWASAHLAEDISVEALARRALMSPRSFARRFKATTGTTPHAWLLGQRLAAAEELLENSDAPVEEIARLVGFGTAAGLRDQFTRRRGVSPRAYRQTFRAAAAVGDDDRAA